MDEYGYGLWAAAIINSAVLILFALSVFHPPSRRDWKAMGAFSAFVVALFAEMQRHQRRPRPRPTDVGSAIGTGTDVAIESSDITLVSGALAGLVTSLSVVTNANRLRRWHPDPLPDDVTTAAVEPNVETPHTDQPSTPATPARH